MLAACSVGGLGARACLWNFYLRCLSTQRQLSVSKSFVELFKCQTVIFLPGVRPNEWQWWVRAGGPPSWASCFHLKGGDGPLQKGLSMGRRQWCFPECFPGPQHFVAEGHPEPELEPPSFMVVLICFHDLLLFICCGSWKKRVVLCLSKTVLFLLSGGFWLVFC